MNAFLLHVFHNRPVVALRLMPYTNGDLPIVGDRITDESGRIGTVTQVSEFPRGIVTFAVNWDSGAAGINYTRAERFALIARGSSQSPC